MEDTATDDAGLARRLASGDRTALATAFDRFAPTLTRYAWAIARSRQDVEQAVQDTFLTLWQRADGLRLPTGTLLPWLLVTCRDRIGTPGLRAEAGLDAPGATAEGPDDLRWIRDDVAVLSDQDRRICELCLLQGYSYDEALQLLGLRVGAVTPRAARSRRRTEKEVTHDEH